LNADRLWVVRHAATGTTDTCYGRTDVATSVPADRATSTLVESFPGTRAPAVVWSSPMSRCLDVAGRFAAHFGARLRVDPSLHELDFGAWEGRPWSLIRSEDRDNYDRWLEEWEHFSPSGGELPADIERRVRAWHGALEKHHTHALIAHAGVIRALRVVSERRSWLDAMQIPADHLAWCAFPLAPGRQRFDD
jgi:alpha-ribazole phosphatase